MGTKSDREKVEAAFSEEGGTMIAGVPAIHSAPIDGQYLTPGVVMVIKPVVALNRLTDIMKAPDKVVAFVEDRARYEFVVYGLDRRTESSRLAYVTEEYALLSGNITEMRNLIKDPATSRILAKYVYLCMAMVEPDLMADVASCVF